MVTKKLRYRFMEIAVAAAIAAPLVHVLNIGVNARRADVPASAWFEVNSIFVPDFALGEDKAMTYDRIIKEPFRGFWVVEVQQKDPSNGSFILRCSGSGVNDYEPQDYIPENLVTWNWFVGNSCPEMPPGAYRLRVSWVLKRPNWPEKQTVAYSNIFTVAPRR